MRRFRVFAAGFVMVVSAGSLQGCGGSSDGQVSPEFRKADLKSQEAMKELMQNSNKPKHKTKSRSRATSGLAPSGRAPEACLIAGNA